MKSKDVIVGELAELDQTTCAEIKDGIITYFDVCQKMHDSGQAYEQATKKLQAAVAGNRDINDSVRTLRFAAREQGLVMAKAAKNLAQLSANCLSLSEKLAVIISTEGDE